MDSNDIEKRARHHHPGQELRGRPTRARTSTSSTPRATPTSAARSSACCRWSTACCCWSTPSRARCRRRASSPEGAGAGPEAHRRRQQDRPARRPARLGRQRGLRPVRRARRHEEQLDFPVFYASGLQGWATLTTRRRAGRHRHAPLFDAILEHVPAPDGDPDGAAAVADQRARLHDLRRPHRHRPRPPRHASAGQHVAGDATAPDGTPVKARINQVLTFQGLEREPDRRGRPGDIVLISASRTSTSATPWPTRTTRAAAADGGRRADADDDFRVNTSPSPAGRASSSPAARSASA